MALTFKDLENFLTVSQTGNLSQASQKLNITQPSLSIAIKKLEAELKTPLFIRTRTGMKMTPIAKALMPKALESIMLYQQIYGQQKMIRFRIGLHPTIGMSILGPFFRFIHEQASHLDFEIINAHSAEINRLVASGDIDFGLVMNPLPFRGLVTRFIGGDEVLLWESPMRYQKAMIYNPQLLQSRSILAQWKKSDHKIIEVENLELIAHLTNCGVGMGILPTRVVQTQKLPLIKVDKSPRFNDKLALVCYPEMLKSTEGKIIFDLLKKSY